MEIEAKFKVERESTFDELMQITSLGSFALMPTPGIEYQHNIYFDTPDRRFNQQRHSLRIRDTGKRRIATVKQSLGAQAGIRRHEEWEVEIGAGAHPREWPASPARDRALDLLGDAELAALITINTRRQFIYALRASAVVAELSLDQGVIAAGGRELDFRELEIELVADGQYAELEALIGELGARFPLSPEPLGKKKRGMALLDGRLGVPPARLQTTASSAPFKTALAAAALRMR